jgi:hypothetical protein
MAEHAPQVCRRTIGDLNHARKSRLRPPETLGERERQLFVDLVAGSKASHFQAPICRRSRYANCRFSLKPLPVICVTKAR